VASSSPPREAELAAFLPLFGLALLGAAHELVVRQTDAYLGPGLSVPRGLSVALSVLACALGLWLGQRALLRAPARAALLQRLACALAVVCALSGPSWFWAFQAPWRMFAVAIALPALAAGLAGAGLGALFQGLGLAYRELGSLRWLLAPLPLLGALALALLATVTLTYAGLWRAGAALGAVISGMCLALSRFGAHFADPATPRRRAAWAAMTVAVASLATAQAFVPASMLLRYPADVVWTEGSEHDLVVTSAQNTFQLFQAEQLRLTSADAYRLAELAVHPVLSRERPGRRVLLLGPAGGFLEHEILKHRSVKELVSISELAHDGFDQSVWPRAAHADSTDPRLRARVAEPLPWLEREPSAFDTIIVALPAPASYAEGKYYTTYFYQLLAGHLAPNGALVVQATSRASLPRAFGTIQRSLSASGLRLSAYEGPVPLQGAVSFIVAAHEPLRPQASNLPQGLRFLDAVALARSFTLAPPSFLDAPASTLDHQRAVEAFHDDHARLGE
jgi:spermidine synthase